MARGDVQSDGSEVKAAPETPGPIETAAAAVAYLTCQDRMT